MREISRKWKILRKILPCMSIIWVSIIIYIIVYVIAQTLSRMWSHGTAFACTMKHSFSRIARLRDLTFDVVFEDRHYYGRNSFCLYLIDVGWRLTYVAPRMQVSFLHHLPSFLLISFLLPLFFLFLFLFLSFSRIYLSHLQEQSYEESDRAAVSTEGAG